MSKHKPKPKPKPEPPPPPPPPPPVVDVRIRVSTEGPVDTPPELWVDMSDSNPYIGVQEADNPARYLFTIPPTERRWGYSYHWNGQELRATDGAGNDVPLPSAPGDYEGPGLTYGGKTPTPGPDPIQPGSVGRISVNGRHFAEEGRGKLPWRGITAFRLLEMIAHGRQNEAAAFLDFCARHRVFPRVLAMARHLFVLDPSEGAAAVPTLLSMCAQRGLFCEVVALADTDSYSMDYRAHFSVIGAAADAAGNCIIEAGNELYPPHQTQDDRLGDPPFVLELARLIPSRVPVSLGSTHADMAESEEIARFTRDNLPNGYATAHDIRTAEEGGWKQVRHPNDLAWVADGVNVQLINDEPFKDDMTPGRQMGTGAVCRVIRDIGDLFHYQGGLQAQVPEGAALNGFLGRKIAWDLVPSDWHGQYLNAGHAGSPVEGFEGGCRCYSSMNGNNGFTVALDSSSMKIKWAPGVQHEVIEDRDGCTIYRVTR